jgi:long-chain acyl-CoA synthetase
MSHVAEKMLVNAGSIFLCGRVHFVQKLDTFAHDLAQAQPTVFLAVPRIWEKFDETLRAKIPSAALRKLLAPLLRSRLGLSRARLVLSGASSIRPTLLHRFQELGITIQEVYGMTENLGITTVNFTGKVRVGTVGQAFDGVVVRTSSEGEILVQSGANTSGYYKQPEATAELFDGSFLRTGDLGTCDSDGYWTLTGRIKDQFKTSKGKFVMPIALENALLQAPAVEQCCVVGEGLHQPVALVVLSSESKNLPNDRLELELRRWLDQVNAKLPSHEKLLSIVSVPEEWGVSNGFLTPTLKVKRAQLEQFYQPWFEGWLQQRSPVILAHR